MRHHTGSLLSTSNLTSFKDIVDNIIRHLDVDEASTAPWSSTTTTPFFSHARRGNNIRDVDKNQQRNTKIKNSNLGKHPPIDPEPPNHLTTSTHVKHGIKQE